MKSLALALAILAGCDHAPVTAPKPAFVPDPQIQSDRWKFIRKIDRYDYILKVEKADELPHVWVTPRFMALNFDDKQEMCNVIFAYYYPDPSETSGQLILQETINGKQVGTYSHRGLQME